MSDINIVLENRDDIRVAVEEKDINVEVPVGKDGRSLRPRGEWSASAAYAYLDLVSYQGSSYVALKAVPAGTLPTDTSYWMLSAEKGEPGTPVWGAITGDLSDQTDLQTALDAKADVIISSASGSIASFSDGSASPVTALSVSIEPVQDLHGYDNPWPAGGGKNILVGKTLSETVRAIDFSFTSDDVLTFSGTNSSASAMAYFNIYPNESGKRAPIKAGTYTFSSKTALPSGVSITLGFKNPDGTAISGLVLTNSQQSVSGTISVDCEYNLYVTVSPSATVSYNGGLQLELGSSATSWTPYSNICPISGHTSAVVTRTGKNLLDKSILTTSSTWQIVPLNIPSGVYTMSTDKPTSDTSKLFLYFRLTGSSTLSSANAVYLNHSVTLTIPDGSSAEVVFRCSEGTDKFSNYNYQLELSSTATAYEVPSIQTVTIDLNGTRYGGTLNVLTGEMTVDFAIKTLTWGTSTGTVLGKTARKIYSLSSTTGIIDMSRKAEALCDLAPFNASSWDGDFVHFDIGGVSAYQAFVWLPVGTDSSQNINILYPLATPVTVQLTPAQLSTLLGTNNIWADTGDTAVTYRADTKRYIDGVASATAKVTRQMIADSATADGKAPKSLATGDLIIVGDELRKATANIGNGSAITASNSTTATLADVIKALQ